MNPLSTTRIHPPTPNAALCAGVGILIDSDGALALIGANKINFVTAVCMHVNKALLSALLLD